MEEFFWNWFDSIIVMDKKVMICMLKLIFFGMGLKIKQDFEIYMFYCLEGKVDVFEY